MKKFIWFYDVCGTDSMNIGLLENKNDISRIKKCFRCYKGITEFEDLELPKEIDFVSAVFKIGEDREYNIFLLAALDATCCRKSYIIAIKKEDWEDA